MWPVHLKSFTSGMHPSIGKKKKKKNVLNAGAVIPASLWTSTGAEKKIESLDGEGAKRDEIKGKKPGAVAVSFKRPGASSSSVSLLSNAPTRQIENSYTECQDLYVDPLLPNSLGLFSI